MTVPVRIAILGYGKIARDAHGPAWQRTTAQGLTEVRTIYEPTDTGCAAATAAFPLATVIQADARAAFNKPPQVDVLDICTPGHLHHELVMQALAAQADVLVEKPLAHSAAEAEEINSARGGALVQVCQTLRLSRPVLKFKDAVASDRVGLISRVQVFHHGRHILSEAEWVTRSRPDGVLFENAIHFLDLVHHLLDLTIPLSIQAQRFQQTSHRPILTGFELFAADELGREVTVDFRQDSLVHSALLSRTYVSAAGADAELRFYPDGFRLLSGIVDPLQDIRAEAVRLGSVARRLLRPRAECTPHDLLISDLLDARSRGAEPLCGTASVIPGITTAENLSRLWKDFLKD